MLIVFRDDILDQVFLGILLLYNSDDLHAKAYFVGLMSLSILHWIAIKRSEFVYYCFLCSTKHKQLVLENQTETKKHLKLLTAFLIFVYIDYVMLEYFYQHVYLTGDVKSNHEQLLLSLFGFEVTFPSYLMLTIRL